MGEPRTLGDYLVPVCASCRCAGCVQGEFYCDEYHQADITSLPASILRKEKNEHPSWYSKQRLEKVHGYVKSTSVNPFNPTPPSGGSDG